MVRQYAKIIAYEVWNFMSIGYAYIDMSKSPIISLCGYNDSGKSALTRSLEVILYDNYSNDQINYIKDGEAHFQLKLHFDDGVKVSKYKYLDTKKSVWEMEKGVEMLYTNRRETGIIALTDVPSPIRDYYGVVSDDITGELLNVRRVDDRLFLINTTGGDNYKIINSVLRCDVLAMATDKANKKKNELQSLFSNYTVSRNALYEQYVSIHVAPDDVLALLQEKVENLRRSKRKLQSLMAIQDERHVLDSIIVPDELPLIDTGKLSALQVVQQLTTDMDIIIQPECPIISTDKIIKLHDLSTAYTTAADIVIQPELTVINTEKAHQLMQIQRLHESVQSEVEKDTSISSDLENAKSELADLSVKHDFKICANCGTIAV